MLQAEIRVMTLDREPDLGNANVGTNIYACLRRLPAGKSPFCVNERK